MMCFLFFPKTIVIFLVLLLQMNEVVPRSGADTDRLALLAIKSKITNDPQGVLRSWNDSHPFCQWQGVTCGRRHQRVTSLNLTGTSLVGSLSPYIGNLTFLRYVTFKHNQLHGNIPPEIGRLSRLQVLSLVNNSFTGEIPINISSCSKLWYLRLSRNNLTGGIPPAIGNLTSLEKLYISVCPLGGSIPDSFRQLINLKVLALGELGLIGSFPSFLFNLSKLEILFFPENKVHGSLPSNLCLRQPHLQRIELSNNHFSGFIPPSISNCSELRTFDVGLNNFEGEIDVDFGKLQYLWWLTISQKDLRSMHLGGMKYFDSLSNCSNLEMLALKRVQLRREIPSSFGNLTKLRFLFLQSCYISGNFPSSIGNLFSLSTLVLQGNNFTGMIPESIGKLQNLGKLNLADNSFTGIIPRSLGNMSVVTKIRITRNKLGGTIPSTIGSCKNLIYLSFSGNKLTGNVPKEIFQLSSLSVVLDLGHNKLSGVLPQDIGNLKNLGLLDLSENQISGELPSSISSCISLETLTISGNLFRGSIPIGLSYLRGLVSVDLSRNNFSGPIPMYLEQIDLKQLNLSYNDFEGEVYVKGIFANASAISVLGNQRLCGGIPELHLSKCKTSYSNKRRKLSTRVVVAISLSSVVAGLSLMSLVLLYSCIKKKKLKPSESTSIKSFEKISYRRLFKATEGFSSANLIGTGGFASVYKGVLEKNDLTVAIKVLNLDHRRGSNSFVAECEALRNIRHRNLVKVITCCSSVDFKGNDFKAIVYDLMQNGSLESWLHSCTMIHHSLHDALYQLNLVQRISIAKDVAYALEYLHCRCGNVVVHCDLKPSNILLDADMVAHVADFGLAKILSCDEHSNVNKSISSDVRGTIGYAPPEYGVGNEVSPSGDIYSYGILLLEMLIGRKPTDPMFQEGLHYYARKALAGGFVLQIVDQILLQGDIKEICLISLVEIGVKCSFESPQDRMDISTVIHELLSKAITST